MQPDSQNNANQQQRQELHEAHGQVADHSSWVTVDTSSFHESLSNAHAVYEVPEQAYCGSQDCQIGYQR